MKVLLAVVMIFAAGACFYIAFAHWFWEQVAWRGKDPMVEVERKRKWREGNR